ASGGYKRLVQQHVGQGAVGSLDLNSLDDKQKAMRRQLHETIQKVSDDIGRRYTFNTAIAAVMELVNGLYKFDDDSESGRAVMQEALEASVLMLSPIVPHIAHGLWQALGHKGAVQEQDWPQVDESALVRDSIEIVVQVNGKLRGKIEVPASADKAAVETAAREEPNVQRFIEGKEVVKVIVVPGKLVNIVIKG
ncbi:MAG: class I tRNA ligase family protein, partial [Gammaproteobacteria bacterium]|nr:class I tRNA ligase family protein [Gammaproteobacteria bacterium]